MAVVDSSVLIPIARSGHLEVLEETFEEIKTLEAVYRETVEDAKGKKGVSKLKEFFESQITLEEFENGKQVAEFEALSETDAKLILLSRQENEPLITNDRAMIQVAKTRDIEAYWLTSVVLKAVKDEVIEKQEGKDMLYNLVQEGMNLDNKIYSKIMKKIEEL